MYLHVYHVCLYMNQFTKQQWYVVMPLFAKALFSTLQWDLLRFTPTIRSVHDSMVHIVEDSRWIQWVVCKYMRVECMAWVWTVASWLNCDDNFNDSEVHCLLSVMMKQQ